MHGGKLADNALKLMRSRFSAYALNLPEYIIATTHPENPHFSNDHVSWKKSISQFSRSCSFKGLEILDFKEEQPFAEVVFTAYITRGDSDCTFTEKSLFELLSGRWLYLSGQVA